MDLNHYGGGGRAQSLGRSDQQSQRIVVSILTVGYHLGAISFTLCRSLRYLDRGQLRPTG